MFFSYPVLFTPLFEQLIFLSCLSTCFCLSLFFSPWPCSFSLHFPASALETLCTAFWFPHPHNTIFFSQSLPLYTSHVLHRKPTNHIIYLRHPPNNPSSIPTIFFSLPLPLILSWPLSQRASLQFTTVLTYPKKKYPLMGSAPLLLNTLAVLSKTLWQMTGD